MLHLLVAGFVIATASCISWYYNIKTEEEKHDQERAKNEREGLYANYQRASIDQTEQAEKERKRLADQAFQDLLKIIHKHEEKIVPIKKGLDELYKIICSEIIADSTSPYRKSALRREFARTEDAYMRLEQYMRYLAYERQIINELWAKESYEQLLKKEAADALLPVEWLYSGKLVTVNLSEIGKKLPVFGHKILFHGHGKRELQQALLLGMVMNFRCW